MNPWSLLFGFRGRIGRVTFWLAFAAVGLASWLGIRASEAALPWMAQVLAPRGINAGFALNLIWLGLGICAVWCATALMAKRLHDRDHSGWWAAAFVLPLSTLALINDAIFLVSRSFTLPSLAQYGVLAVAGSIGLWALWQCVQPSRSP